MRSGRRSNERGRNIWSCTPCSVLLLSAVLPRDAAAMYQGNGIRDTIHRVYKVKVTEDVRAWSSNGQLQQKREGDSCPTNYSLCAASLGGDCCPDNYACAESSCYATTAAVQSCAGKAGQYACAFSLGGGCCSQGLICGPNGCTSPVGATATIDCPNNYFACPASLNGNCCSNGMGCGLSLCYTLSPATTTLTYTTTEDGSVLIITTTSVTTSTPTAIATATEGDGAVAKYYPSTMAKAKATEPAAASTGGSSGGLSKGAIGGIVAAAVVILIAVLTAAFFILKRLKHTEQVVQTQRETTSGTRTRQTTEKNKSEVQVRVVPTPSEVDAFDYDPLMMNSSVASPLRPGQRAPAPRSRHVRGGSDTGSQPSLWSGQSATRWPTPSVNSEYDDSNSNNNNNNGGQTTYFELPPRAHHPNDGAARPALRQSVNSNESSAYSYHDYTTRGGHGRNASNASELSAGSGDELMPRPVELDARGARTPELPGSDTEGESTTGGRWRRGAPRRKGTAASINDIVSPMSVRPGAAQVGRPRRRGDSQVVSPLDGGIAVAGTGGGAASVLGSIDESVGSVTVSHSLHGHYGPDPGEAEAKRGSSSTTTLPGFVPLERPSQDASERR